MDLFSASTVISMEMAKTEIFSYVIVCFVFEMENVGYPEICSVYKWSVFFIVFIVFIISESSRDSLKASSSRHLKRSKWFASIC